MGIVCCVIIVSVLYFKVARAQQFASDPNAESVLVTNSPENPQPGDTVSFNVTSYLSDLDTASVTWYVNNSKVTSGTGARAFSTKLGGIGTKTVVKVVVRTKEGNTITQVIPFSSVSVDLLWEAHSYTPPFYKGKALLTAQESVRIVAVPHLNKSTTSLSPTNLIYTWSKDGRVLGSESGYGHNTLDLDQSTTYKPVTISVKVTSKDTSIDAEKSLSLNPTSPALVAYASSPALGTLYNQALQGNMQLADKELNIALVPYYFNTTSRVFPHVVYAWSINDSVVSHSSNSILTVRNSATTTGISQISAMAQIVSGNKKQGADTTFNLQF